MLKYLVIFCAFVILSQEVILKKTEDDVKNYYRIEDIGTSDNIPIIIREINQEDSTHYNYKIVLPVDNNNDYVDDFKDYVIIKSKKRTIDVPYTLIKRLDKIKYMILWLNLYCNTHPDCDKSALNAELKKVSKIIFLFDNKSLD